MNTPEEEAEKAGTELAKSAEGELTGATREFAPLPDVATMTRWANEMFRGGAGLDEIGKAGIPTLSAAALPNEAQARQLFSAAPNASGAAMPGASAMTSITSGSGIPSQEAVTAAALQPMGAAWPLGAAQAGGPWTSALLPNESSFRALAESLPLSGWPTGLGNAAPSGQLPSERDAFPSFYFLDQPQGTASKGASGPAQAPTIESYTFLPDLISQLAAPGGAFDAASIRRDFPILDERINGKRLVWLDNAATTQKPRAVIDRISHFYERENSNIHRAAHTLAARATDAYEAARESVRRFLNAGSTREIVFVRGATEGVNLVSQSWGRRHVGEGDEIVVTWLEHHSNIVPWQLLCAEKGARLRVAPIDDRGQVILEAYEKLLGPKTRLVALAHVSNALGTILPIREMTEMAHRHGARVLVDGAQAVSHMQVDVQAIDCDWYVFSGHKVFAPTGIGVVRGKPDALADSPPWQGGGNMIADVTFEKTVYQAPPMRFEAGTGSIADAVGLGAALDYVSLVGMENIARHEHELLDYATRHLTAIPGLHLIGTAAEKAGVISLVIDGFRTEEIGEALNREGIAVRTGHHCAQPALRRYGLEASVRPSLALYNTCEDVDVLLDALRRLVATRGRRTAP
jgi:cysteine desulfurase / selenocysteine lyase